MARPTKWTEIPPEKVEALTRIGAPATEIAAFFGVSHDTISRRFAKEIAKGNASRKIKLRSLQFKAAESGNVAMLIFLGKNMLDQSDRMTYEKPEEEPTTVIIHRTDGNGRGQIESNGNGNGNGNGQSKDH